MSELKYTARGQKLASLLKERIVFLDGAMGTSLQRFNLSENDYKGELLKEHKFNLKGNNDILSITVF